MEILKAFRRPWKCQFCVPYLMRTSLKSLGQALGNRIEQASWTMFWVSSAQIPSDPSVRPMFFLFLASSVHGAFRCYMVLPCDTIIPMSNSREYPLRKSPRHAVHDPERLSALPLCCCTRCMESQASQGDAECVGRASAVTWRMVPMVPAESDVIWFDCRFKMVQIFVDTNI